MRVIYGLKQINMKNYKVDPEDEDDGNVNPNPNPPPPPPPPPTIGG